ncbi:MAG: SMP-30/gluconolactonase/LRE family protein [Phycisphaerae bacterium]|nr:SMP-30/gluconolactonase/LRE family protein [Phycisphaerae bacterium]
MPIRIPKPIFKSLYAFFTGASCCLSALLSGCADPCRCPSAKESIVADGAVLKEVSAAFQFTEGPAADAAGNIYFTDQPSNRIMVYTADGRLETFLQPAGRSNGLYFDRQGFLIACADENNELWRINIKTKQHSVLAQSFHGKRLNGPNDVWAAPNGDIYFTDPFYKRSWWSHSDTPQDVQAVYRLAADGQTLMRVADDLEKPNGLIGTPDGKTLYIADIGAGRTYVYKIQPDGMLTDKRLFCQMGSDGMTLDCCGNVYLTGRGVTVFNPAGEKIRQIDIPQRWTANVTFGGKDGKILFITAGTAVYTLQMNVCGAKQPNRPNFLTSNR